RSVKNSVSSVVSSWPCSSLRTSYSSRSESGILFRIACQPRAEPRPAGTADLLPKRGQDVGDPPDRLGEDLGVRKGDQAKVVGLEPVEASAVGDQDLLAPQQVEHEGLVVLDPVDLRVEA